MKIDHFDKMHALGNDGKIDGAPNWRQVIKRVSNKIPNYKCMIDIYNMTNIT